MYEPTPWQGERLIWPPYVVGGRSGGHLTDAEAHHVRANYGSKLTMIDHWFGRILDEFDRHDLWDDTALIVCTDHGHYLGEERTGERAAAATCGASRWCRSSRRSGTSR